MGLDEGELDYPGEEIATWLDDAKHRRANLHREFHDYQAVGGSAVVLQGREHQGMIPLTSIVFLTSYVAVDSALES